MRCQGVYVQGVYVGQYINLNDLFTYLSNTNYDENPTNPRILWYTTSSTISVIQKVVESNEPNKEPFSIASCIVSRHVVAITLDIRDILCNLLGNQTCSFKTPYVLVNLRLAGRNYTYIHTFNT